MVSWIHSPARPPTAGPRPHPQRQGDLHRRAQHHEPGPCPAGREARVPTRGGSWARRGSRSTAREGTSRFSAGPETPGFSLEEVRGPHGSVIIDVLERSDVLVAHAQDRLVPAEQDCPAVFAFQIDVVEGLASDLGVVAVHHAVRGHADLLSAYWPGMQCARRTDPIGSVNALGPLPGSAEDPVPDPRGRTGADLWRNLGSVQPPYRP
jgi:hypothetical protein